MKMIKVLILLAAVLAMFGCEGTQKAAYDVKADVVGTDRTATIYSKFDGKLVDTISDKSMVFTRTENSTILWLGDVNKKVYIVNAMVVVKDN